MPPTTSYKRGDVVLVPFPFSDQTSVKQRPSLVISVDEFQGQAPDLLIMGVTSQVREGRLRQDEVDGRGGKDLARGVGRLAPRG